MKAHFILKAIDGAPGEFQILPYGTVEIEGEKPAILDDEAMDAIIAQFEGRGNDMVIDYEHQTHTGKRPRPRAGSNAWLRKGPRGSGPWWSGPTGLANIWPTRNTGIFLPCSGCVRAIGR